VTTLTEVKFVYTGYLDIVDADNSMDAIEQAMEIIRAEYGNEIADYGKFTIEKGEENATSK
jgi:hypothetical protein